MVSVCPVPPLTLPVIEPLTPPELAVIVTFEAGPSPFTTPVELTGAHALELCQLADLVMSLVPLLKVAVAVSCTEFGAVTARVLEPACVTDTEFGWLTKNPLQPAPSASSAKIPTQMIQLFRPKLSMFKTFRRRS
jgi:hypothetical protein